MGRRKGNAKPKPKETGDDRILALCGELVEVCSASVPDNPAQVWTQFEQISDLLGKITALQPPWNEPISREDGLSNFVSWCKTMKVENNGVEIGNFDRYGYGLRATDPLEKEQIIVKVPRRAMLTAENAERSPDLKDAVRSDPVLKGMSNVTLAMFILNEKLKGNDSDWKHYLNVLPHTYNTVLYFSKDEFSILKPSKAFDQAVSIYRSIARQYGYFYQLIANPTSYFAKSVLTTHKFTYEAYRWAVSSVFTRLNMIPATENGSWQPMVPALIPYWDMANHAQGRISTDFDVESNRGICFAMQDYTVGEQVFIYYGPRENAQFVLNAGFLYDGHTNDYTNIRLGLAKSDKLYNERKACLDVYKMPVATTYEVTAVAPPFAKAMLSFGRCFNATADELQAMMLLGASEVAASPDDPVIKPVGKDNEIRTWTFLKNRLFIVLKGYPKTRAEYSELINGPGLDAMPPNQQLVTKLIHSEMCIIERAMGFAEQMIGELKQLNDTDIQGYVQDA